MMEYMKYMMEYFDLGDTIELYHKGLSQLKGFVVHYEKWELSANITYKIKGYNKKIHTINAGMGYGSNFYTSRIVLTEKTCKDERAY